MSNHIVIICQSQGPNFLLLTFNFNHILLLVWTLFTSCMTFTCNGVFLVGLNTFSTTVESLVISNFTHIVVRITSALINYHLTTTFTNTLNLPCRSRNIIANSWRSNKGSPPPTRLCWSSSSLMPLIRADLLDDRGWL